MPGGRIVDSETTILTSATSSQFISCSALKEEDGLFGPVRKLMPPWVTLCMLFQVSEMSWVVSASVPIHSHSRATARLTVILKGVLWGQSPWGNFTMNHKNIVNVFDTSL